MSEQAFQPARGDILVVDDNPDDLYLTRRDLEALGHRVSLASTAREALALIEEAYPDVLMTDVGLPGMDGIELLQTVRARADGSWIPSLVFTGSLDEATQMRALEAGADAYLCKPASRKMLRAKLGVILRLRAMQRQAEARNKELAHYRVLQEEEQRLARFVMERLINREALGDPALHHWIHSAAEFSGDLIAAARTPGNVLHVLLADGAGHGLAASLNVLPVTAPFYRMTARGFGIDAIAREINNKVRALLPVLAERDRQVAGSLSGAAFSTDSKLRRAASSRPPSAAITPASSPISGSSGASKAACSICCCASASLP